MPGNSTSQSPKVPTISSTPRSPRIPRTSGTSEAAEVMMNNNGALTEGQETNNDESLSSLGAHSNEMGHPNLGDVSEIQDAGEMSTDRVLLLADEQDGTQDNEAMSDRSANTEAEDGPIDEEEDIKKHLRTMAEQKNWIKGLMDISLLTANANQLRQAFDQCEPFRTLLVVLLSISIVTQVVATCILIFDHYEARRNKFAVCRRCRAAIAFTMVIIVVVNIVVLSLWDQNMDECDLGPN